MITTTYYPEANAFYVQLIKDAEAAELPAMAAK